MNREYQYYFVYILLPFICLCVLFLFVFFIPPESGERIGFGVTVLLSMSVYLLVISGKLSEKSDNVPMLGVCFVVVVFVLVLALLFAIYTMRVARRRDKPKGFLKKNVAPISSPDGKEELPVENDLALNVNEISDYSGYWLDYADKLDRRFFFAFASFLILCPPIIGLVISQMSS